ncbi:MAG: FAD-binding oxidoreductase [Acidobacteria bacterium]|nr:FAD-binding oxidoreductase [Acidobacteriota bacterium]
MSLLGFIRRARADVEVAVVGAGLPALAVALELARRAKRVSVLGWAGAEERSAGLGLVVLGPGRPYPRVVSALGRDDARAVWSAGRSNLDRLRAFLEETRHDCGYDPRGSFLLARDREEAVSLARGEDMLRDDEFPGEFLDHYMLETHFDVSGFAGAYWAAHGGELDGARLAATVATAARASGVAFRPAPVRALESGRWGTVIETDEGSVRAAQAVVATDAVARALVPELGASLCPAAPQRLRVVVEEGARVPTAARTADGRLAWQARGGNLTLAATGGVRPDHAQAGSSEAELVPQGLPVVAGGGRGWVESAEVAVDGLPVVGRIAGRPLAVACGFGALAASFSFAAAAWVADALLTDRDPTPRALHAGRFEPGPA